MNPLIFCCCKIIQMGMVIVAIADIVINVAHIVFLLSILLLGIFLAIVTSTIQGWIIYLVGSVFAAADEDGFKITVKDLFLLIPGVWLIIACTALIFLAMAIIGLLLSIGMLKLATEEMNVDVCNNDDQL